MATGTVKWFDDAKGFGFITQDGDGEEIYVHNTSIKNSGGIRSLVEGQKVKFEVERIPNKPYKFRAIDVFLI